jgi:hypothetical protein
MGTGRSNKQEDAMSKKLFPKEIFVVREEVENEDPFLVINENEGDGLVVGESREEAIYELKEVRKLSGTYVRKNVR